MKKNSNEIDNISPYLLRNISVLQLYIIPLHARVSALSQSNFQ